MRRPTRSQRAAALLQPVRRQVWPTCDAEHGCVFSLARAEGGGAGCAGDGMGRAGWETRGEGHRGMRVMTHRDGYGGAHAVTTAGHTREQRYGRTGQAVDDSKRRSVATRMKIRLDSPRSVSWWLSSKPRMAGSGAHLHRAHQQRLEGTRCAGFGRGLGRSDDIPSAATSTKAVRRLQRRVSTRRPFLDSGPNAEKCC